MSGKLNSLISKNKYIIEHWCNEVGCNDCIYNKGNNEPCLACELDAEILKLEMAERENK